MIVASEDAWRLHASDAFAIDDLTAGRSLPRVWSQVFADGGRRLAFTGDTGDVTYKELDDFTARVAGGLSALGVGPGDRVAAYAPTSWELVALYIAALRRGAVFLPINSAYRLGELDTILRDGAPRYVAVADDSSARLVEEASTPVEILGLGDQVDSAEVNLRDLASAAVDDARDRADADDPAMLVFTSGTTGSSKAVSLSHGNLLAGSRAVTLAWDWTAEDRLLLALPLFHLHGLGVGLNGALTVGCETVVHSTFDADRVLRDIGRRKVTMFFGVPTMYQRLVERDIPSDLSSLRLVVSGSAPLPESLFRMVADRLGTQPLERYGMTETLMNISNPLRGERRPGSVGLPLPGVEVRLVSDGADVPAGSDGEILLRGPNVFAEYANDPIATRDSFQDGWFRSGDLGREDPDGYIRITGRLKELIISGGYNVFPREIEEVLADHPDVAEAAVVGAPSLQWGEEVTAYVVPARGRSLNPDELKAWCSARLARFKTPKQIHLVDELPRNALGKVQRHLLGTAHGNGDAR